MVWKDTLYLYKRLYPFVRPYWKKFFLAVACSVPVSLCAGGIAYLVKPALDDIFLKKDLQMLILVPICILALYAIRGSFEYGFNYFLGSIGQYITNDIRNALYKHLQTLSLSYFQKNQTGAIITRVTNDVTVLSGALNEGCVDIFKEVVTAIGLMAVLFKQDPKLACVSFLILPWMVLPIIRFGRKSRKFTTKGQEKVGIIATFIHEAISGCRIVKAFCMEEYENARFAQENRRLMQLRLKRMRIRSISGPLMEFIGGCAGAAVILYGGYNVIKGTATAGTFFSFTTALLLLYGPARISAPPCRISRKAWQGPSACLTCLIPSLSLWRRKMPLRCRPRAARSTLTAYHFPMAESIWCCMISICMSGPVRLWRWSG